MDEDEDSEEASDDSDDLSGEEIKDNKKELLNAVKTLRKLKSAGAVDKQPRRNFDPKKKKGRMCDELIKEKEEDGRTARIGQVRYRTLKANSYASRLVMT